MRGIILVVCSVLAFIPLLVGNGCISRGASYSAGEAVHDKEIVSRLQSAFVAGGVASGREVEVHVERGVVSLNGFVRTPEDRDKAGQIASATPGVVRVYNNLLLPTGRLPGGR